MLRLLAAASLAAAQICPESHPHECSAPTTDSYGPCCDVSADCQCKPAEWIHGEELDGRLGAAYLPRTQPIGDPDASCAVGAAAPGRILHGVNWGGCFTCTTTGDTRGELLNATDLAEACLARCKQLAALKRAKGEGASGSGSGSGGGGGGGGGGV